MFTMDIQIYLSNGSTQPDDFILTNQDVALTPWQIPLLLLLAILILLTIIGNIFILIAIAKHKPLRVPQNYLLASLAIADLMVAVFVMPVSAVITVSWKWIFSQAVCNMWISMDVLYCTASILNLCVISLDRYWAITDPVKYANKRTVPRMLVSIAIVWALSVIITITPLFGWNTGSDLEHSVCEISQNVYYMIFSTFGAFFIPATIILVVYYRLFIVAKKRIRKNLPHTTVPMLLLNKSSVHQDPAPASPCSPAFTPEVSDSSRSNSTDSNTNNQNSTKHDDIMEENFTETVKPRSCSCEYLSRNSATESQDSCDKKAIAVARAEQLRRYSSESQEEFSTESQESPTESQKSPAECQMTPTIMKRPGLNSKESTESKKSSISWSPQIITRKLPKKCQRSSSIPRKTPRPIRELTESQRSSSVTDSIESQKSCEEHLYTRNLSNGQGIFQDRNGYGKMKRLNMPSGHHRSVSASSPPPSSGSMSPQIILKHFSFSFSRGSNPCIGSDSPTRLSMASQHSSFSLTSLALEERMREKRALAAAREHRATRTVIIVTGSFLLCWLPFFISALILPLCKDCYLPKICKLIFLWLGYFNSMLNPIIYTIFNKDFKDPFKKLHPLRCKRYLSHKV